MISISALLVFGTLATVAWSILGSNGPTLPPGAGTFLHWSVPWPFVVALTAGATIGLRELYKRPTKARGALVALEVFVAAAGLWFFLGDNALPHHSLNIAVGDPFPAYSLRDQDGRLRTGPLDDSPAAKLFVFYRGDW